MKRALVLAALVACDRSPPGAKKYEAKDGGPLQTCATEIDCAAKDASRPDVRCYYPAPYFEDQHGFCAGPEPSCVVTQPFCAMSGRTIHVCRFPSQPWRHRGACDGGT
jgi:hypothetical protein